MPTPVLDELSIVIDRHVGRALPGDRRAPGVGAGTELAQLRPYIVGDDLRHLDPAASARTGEPHVRLHVPERTLTTWIALDVSPSMAFGSALRLKADVAEGVALAVGRLAVRRAGAVGLVRFGDGEIRISPPRGARPGVVSLERALRAGVLPDGESAPDALGSALQGLGRVAKRPGLVVVISDLRDQEGWARPLGALRARHAVIVAEVGDPLESALPDVGTLAVVDPETGRRADVDTSDLRVRARYAELERERRDEVAAELRRLRVAHLRLSTDGDWLAQLGRGLR